MRPLRASSIQQGEAMGHSQAYPQLTKYIAALPAGLSSYPECRSKGSLIYGALEGHDVNVLLPGLPEPLQELVVSPPPAGVWTPAVYADAIFYAVCDRYYPADAQMLAWSEKRTAQTGAGLLYRVFLRVSSPKLFLSTSAKLSRILQRGTSVENELLEDGRVIARFGFPPNLHTYGNLLGNVAMYSAMVKLTGGTNVQAHMASWDETSAVFECTWDSESS